jgi:two-component system LytT family response regulator
VQGRLRQRAELPLQGLVNHLLAEGAATPEDAYLRRILVKETGRMFLVRTGDISHFEADGNYVTLHTAQRPYLFYESLSGLETRLDPAQFVRVSRSHLVNLDYIAELETYFSGDYLVKLTTGHKLKWTRGYRDNLKAFLSRLA